MKKGLNVIGIGEVLWDVFPNTKQLGGAPCNFVYHANQLGANGLAVTAVGNDESGREIIALLNKKNVSTDLIQINGRPTGTVEVKLNQQGIPEYIIHENVAWDYIQFDDSVEGKLFNADIICFGTLAQRSHISSENINKMLKSVGPDTLIVFDVNLRQRYFSKEIIERSLQLCHVLKLNEEELQIISAMLQLKGESYENRLVELRKRYQLQLLAFTHGSAGSLLLTPSAKSFLSTPQIRIKDTVGAGDSFTAAMVVGYARGESLNELHQKAVDVSAFVCTQEGAMPEYDEVQIIK